MCIMRRIINIIQGKITRHHSISDSISVCFSFILRLFMHLRHWHLFPDLYNAMVSEKQQKIIEKIERVMRKQAAEIGQLREANVRLQSENTTLRHERDEARVALQTVQRALKTLQLEHAALRKDMGQLVHAIEHADERLVNLIHKQFGASSERLCTHGNSLITEIVDHLIDADIVESAEAAALLLGTDTDTELVAEDSPQNPKKKQKRPANAGGRDPLPADLERQHGSYFAPEDHPSLRYATGVEVIGSRIIERLDVPALKIIVEALTCQIVKITRADGSICQETLVPPSMIHGGQVTDTFLVNSVVDKVIDHLPANRQEKRAARQDQSADIPRSKITRWHIQTAQFLAALAECIFAEVCADDIIGIDDTVHRLRVSDKTCCQQARLWAISSTSGTYYMFSTTREAKWITALLENYEGLIMADAYAGHKQLLALPNITALFCWAHVRRKFVESADKKRRAIMIALIRQLYAVEDELEDQTPEQRTFLRSSKAKPILRNIKAQIDAWELDPAVLPKSGIGKACAYTRKLWDGLERYACDSDAPIDNNFTERAMRPNALHRKNSLFSASEKGARAYAILMTVTQSALLHDLNPISYLNNVIEDIHYDRRPLAELTPKAYAKRLQANAKISS